MNTVKTAVLLRNGKLSLAPINKEQEAFLAEKAEKGFSLVTICETPAQAQETVAGLVAGGHATTAWPAFTWAAVAVALAALAYGLYIAVR